MIWNLQRTRQEEEEEEFVWNLEREEEEEVIQNLHARGSNQLYLEVLLRIL